MRSMRARPALLWFPRSKSLQFAWTAWTLSRASKKDTVMRGDLTSCSGLEDALSNAARCSSLTLKSTLKLSSTSAWSLAFLWFSRSLLRSASIAFEDRRADKRAASSSSARLYIAEMSLSSVSRSERRSAELARTESRMETSGVLASCCLRNDLPTWRLGWITVEEVAARPLRDSRTSVLEDGEVFESKFFTLFLITAFSPPSPPNCFGLLGEGEEEEVEAV
mmetsp:Transcript_9146/g.26016  ORF Transcript_9146/g.26016 Transcript_9146/m.26016 type:complete len:222 (+) Transcript_9146:1396-2061(+)